MYYRPDISETKAYLLSDNRKSFIFKNGKRYIDLELDLSYYDLSNLDLTGVNFGQTRLDETNLAGSNLTNANFSRAICIRTNFNKANLTNANFSDTILCGSRFLGSIMDGIILNRAIISRIWTDRKIRVYNFPEYDCFRVDDIFSVNNTQKLIKDWKLDKPHQSVAVFNEMWFKFYWNILIKIIDL